MSHSPAEIRPRTAKLVLSVVAAFIFLHWSPLAVAIDAITSEDRSRFTEVSYTKTEPGMLSPAEYVSFAEQAIKQRFPKVQLSLNYQNGVVTRRTYNNAPSADRDIICVTFVYRTVGNSRFRSGHTLVSQPGRTLNALEALIRKDRSKVYVNRVRYKVQ